MLADNLLLHRDITPSGCWNWTRAKISAGYGEVLYHGRMVYVHRLSAHLFNNFDLDSKLQIMHTCDNPACFNPEHLKEGTNNDNIYDSMLKGRRTLGHKIRCTNGHLMTDENIYISPSDGRRRCMACRQEQSWKNTIRRRKLKS